MSDIVYTQKSLIVIERPPCVRTLRILCEPAQLLSVAPTPQLRFARRERYYRLALPWQVYFIHGETSSVVHLAFRNAPLDQTDQVLCYPNFWNIYPSLRVCDNNDLKPTEEAIESIWRSTWNFNFHLHDKYTDRNAYCRDLRVSSWSSWQKHTLADPDFITTVNWHPWGNFDKMLGEITRLYGTKPV